MAVMDPFTELEWRLIGGHMVPVMRLRGSAAPAAADGGCPAPSSAPQTFGPPSPAELQTVTTAAAAQPPMTGDRVAGQRGVRAAEMRAVVDVVNRSRDVRGRCHEPQV